MLTKKLTYLFVAVVIFSATLFYACTKIDYESNSDFHNIEKFYKGSESSPLLKRIAEKIKQKGVDANFIKQYGYPVWDKVIINQNKTNAQARSTESGDTIVIIPLVEENENQVGSFIEAEVNSEIELGFYDDSEYKEYPYSLDYSGAEMTAEQYALIFMALTKDIFGTNEYKILDSNLFRFEKNGEFYTAAKLRPVEIQTNGWLTSIRMCYWVWVEKENPGFLPENNGLVEELQCQTLYNWNGGGSTGTGGDWPTTGEGGGTSGSGGGSNPNPGSNGGGSNGGSNPPRIKGWIPAEDEDDVNWVKGSRDLEHWYTSPDDAVKVSNWLRDNIDTVKLDSCRRIILNRLLNTNGQNLLGKLLTKSDKATDQETYLEDFNIKYISSDTFSATSNTLGEFSQQVYDPNTGRFVAYVNLNNKKMNTATDIMVANVIIHETIHAYMAFILSRLNDNKPNSLTPEQIASLGFSEIFSSYVDTLVRRDSIIGIDYNDINNDDQYDHNYMTNNIINRMSDVLKEFDNNRLSNILGSNTAGDEYYWTLTWGGLYWTETFKNCWFNYPSTPIVNAAVNEDDKNGLKYALTSQRLININNRDRNETLGNADSKGNKPISGGCY